jgi:uncharacterized protein (TIGR03000 family)
MKKVIVRGASCVALALAVCVPALRADDKPADKDAPPAKAKPADKGRETKIRVFLPTEEAKVWFDDKLTTQTGKKRTFSCHALEVGKRYTYRVVAQWTENGREVNHETKITFRGGEDVAVDFNRR